MPSAHTGATPFLAAACFNLLTTLARPVTPCSHIETLSAIRRDLAHRRLVSPSSVLVPSQFIQSQQFRFRLGRLFRRKPQVERFLQRGLRGVEALFLAVDHPRLEVQRRHVGTVPQGLVDDLLRRVQLPRLPVHHGERVGHARRAVVSRTVLRSA